MRIPPRRRSTDRRQMDSPAAARNAWLPEFQRPAHALRENVTNATFVRHQASLLREVTTSVELLRRFWQTHPANADWQELIMQLRMRSRTGFSSPSAICGQLRSPMRSSNSRCSAGQDSASNKVGRLSTSTNLPVVHPRGSRLASEAWPHDHRQGASPTRDYPASTT